MTKGFIPTVTAFLLFYVSNNDAFTSPLPYRVQGTSGVSSLSATTIDLFQSRRYVKNQFLLYSTAAEDQSATKTFPIILNGQNIELTPALEEYVNKRIGGILKKLATSNSVRECDVVLSVNKNPKVCVI
jgi:Sigma 54 modulation protein / S30EA ribosomal protein